VTYTEASGLMVDPASNTWTLTIPNANAVQEGTYNVTAYLTDPRGNVSPDQTSGELIVDTTAPNVPTVVTLVTSNHQPTLTGTARLMPGDTLSVMVNGVTYTTANGLLINGDSWSLPMPVVLPDARYSVTARITDLAGNVSPDITSGELLIDTVAPLAPTVDRLSTNDGTPVLTGTAPLGEGERLQVTVNGKTYQQSESGPLTVSNGVWTLNVPEADALADATYDVTATILDMANNTTLDATSGELIVNRNADFTPPEVVSIERMTPLYESTDADSVTFVVTFNEAVTDVTAADFRLKGAASTGATVTV
jgi:hypothetical protein